MDVDGKRSYTKSDRDSQINTSMIYRLGGTVVNTHYDYGLETLDRCVTQRFSIAYSIYSIMRHKEEIQTSSLRNRKKGNFT